MKPSTLPNPAAPQPRNGARPGEVFPPVSPPGGPGVGFLAHTTAAGFGSVDGRKRSYYAKKAAGICVSASCYKKAAPGVGRCSKHRDAHLKDSREWKKRNRRSVSAQRKKYRKVAYAALKDGGRCVWCMKKHNDATVICAKCRASFRAKRHSYTANWKCSICKKPMRIGKHLATRCPARWRVDAPSVAEYATARKEWSAA